MRLFILFLALLSSSCFAQSKDKEYKAVKDTLEKLKAAKEALLKSSADSFEILGLARRQILELKQVIKDNNDVSLRAVFENKYTAKYFQETDLEVEDKTVKFRNSNTLINSVKVDADQQTLNLSTKALAFNKNYLALFQMRQSVLNVKYDDKKVKDALMLIDSLPQLDTNSNLYKTKVKMANLLKNYKDNTCALKKLLDILKPRKDQKALNPTYLKYEKESRFENYQYLITIISKMKKDVKSYTSDELQPCEDAKNEVPDSRKIESPGKK
jgi:hypothetical protein